MQILDRKKSQRHQISAFIKKQHPVIFNRYRDDEILLIIYFHRTIFFFVLDKK